MEQPQEAFAKMARAPATLLIKQAAMHLALWVLALSLFAAADSWSQLTGWTLATLLTVLTGIAAGFLTVNLVHEWFHYLGAKFSAADYTVRDKPSLFVFDWNFEKKHPEQVLQHERRRHRWWRVGLVGCFQCGRHRHRRPCSAGGRCSGKLRFWFDHRMAGFNAHPSQQKPHVGVGKN